MKRTYIMLTVLLFAGLLIGSASASQITATKEAALGPLQDAFNPGDTISYTMTVENPAGNAQTNTLTRIWDTLPNGTVIDFLGPDLVQAPGEVDTFYADYVVDWADAEWIPALSAMGVKNRFEAEGYDSAGDDVYALVTKNSEVLQCIEGYKINDCTDDGIEGWEICLYEAGETVPLACVETDADGYYSFCELHWGTYDVCEEVQEGYADPGDPCEEVTLATTVEDGPVTVVDFYNWPQVCIEGTKYNDLTDTGIEGWPIYLLSWAEEEIASTMTDENGNYSFCGLLPDTGFYVCEGELEGYVEPEEPCQWVDTYCDDITGIDFYNVPLGCLTVCKDVDMGDCVSPFGSDEFQICVMDSEGSSDCVWLEDSECHTWTDLMPGEYNVYELEPPEVYAVSGEGPVMVSAGGECAEVIIENTFLPAAIGDYVWLDEDMDGIQDASEAGVAGVTVNLYNDCLDPMGPIGSQITDADGYYLFNCVYPGNPQECCYYVEFELPEGYEFTLQNVGDDALDSDADPATGMTDCIQVDPGETDLTWDAGIWMPEPCFEIEKYVRVNDSTWLEADTAPGPEALVGDFVQFKLEISNCGNVPVEITRINDDYAGPAHIWILDTLPVTLDVDGTLTYYTESILISEDDCNEEGWLDTIYVTGVYGTSYNVTQHDPAWYYVYCPSGCTYTPGYWKTHSKLGSAPYDDTWVGIEDDPFYLSGMSWVEVINVNAKNNAYYQLSFHYIAAVLNTMKDDPAYTPTEVADAMADADSLFSMYTPGDIAGLKGNDPVRKQFLAAHSILSDFNEGYIGPGHCDDDYMPV